MLEVSLLALPVLSLKYSITSILPFYAEVMKYYSPPPRPLPHISTSDLLAYMIINH